MTIGCGQFGRSWSATLIDPQARTVTSLSAYGADFPGRSRRNFKRVTKPRRPPPTVRTAKKILARASRRARPRNRKRASTQFAYSPQIFSPGPNQRGLHPKRERPKRQTALHRRLVRQSCRFSLTALGRDGAIWIRTPASLAHSLSLAGSASGVLFTTGRKALCLPLKTNCHNDSGPLDTSSIR